MLQPLFRREPPLTPSRRTGTHPRLALVAAAVMALTPACKEPLTGFGAGARARTGIDQFYGALSSRHLDIVRNGKYEYSRVAMARGALTPSRIFDDTAAWTGSSGPVRILETFGTHADDHYIMSSQRSVPAPQKPGDGRHVSTLSQLSDSEYRWDTSVDFALGNVRTHDIALVISRLLVAGEGLDERSARADLASAAPRTSAALGSLFSLDTLRPVVMGDGTTLLTLGISVHSDQLRQRTPAFGEFVHKYVDPSRLRFVLTDRGGAPYIEILGHDRFLSLRLRSIRGHLVPLYGPPRTLPDSLIVIADFTTKMKMWHIGFHDLAMEFMNGQKGDGERDWTVVARKEPQWNLPMITARLLRAPLRRPFAGEGALFRLGLREGEGDQPTVLFRQSRLAVQESAILRFINSLTNTAMEDFGARVEKEENLWLRELFMAMRDDARAAVSP